MRPDTGCTSRRGTDSCTPSKQAAAASNACRREASAAAWRGSTSRALSGSPERSGGAKGIVYLVGAGPGDPGLLTRRGAEVLARADVVAYDRLVHPDLLCLAPDAELIDVGKKPGQSAEGQSRINDALIEHAHAGKVVV